MAESENDDPDWGKLIDSEVYDHSQWTRAFKQLWNLGHNVIPLKGPEHEQNRKDIVQDAIIYTSKRIRRGKCRTWGHAQATFRIKVKQVTYDFFRSRHFKKGQITSPINSWEESEGENSSDFVLWSWDELSVLIARLVPPRLRKVFHLFYQDELTTKEIAEKLGKDKGTIDSDLYRGRNQLRKLLQDL